MSWEEKPLESLEKGRFDSENITYIATTVRIKHVASMASASALFSGGVERALLRPDIAMQRWFKAEEYKGDVEVTVRWAADRQSIAWRRKSYL